MLTLIIILTCLVILHFVYDAIILPSIRMSLRFKLFALRDRIRLLKLMKQNQFDSEAFIYLDQAINNTISILHQLDFSTILQVRNTIEHNPALKRRIQKRLNTIERCNLNEITNIKESIKQTSIQVLVANHGAWFIYLIPVFIIALVFSKLKNLVNILIAIINVPENEFSKVIPLTNPSVS